MASGGAPVEIEVKLAVVDQAAIRALIDQPDPDRLAGFEADGPQSIDDIVDRYVDTAIGGGALRAAGLRARLRSKPGGTVVTLKGRSETRPDGVTVRMEHESPATPALDPTAWPPSPARQLILEAIGGAALVEIAELRQRRHVRLLRRGQAIVELSLDELSAVDASGTVKATRVELEAELKAGPPSALADLGQALANVAGIEPPVGSKLEFALAARTER